MLWRLRFVSKLRHVKSNYTKPSSPQLFIRRFFFLSSIWNTPGWVCNLHEHNRHVLPTSFSLSLFPRHLENTRQPNNCGSCSEQTARERSASPNSSSYFFIVPSKIITFSTFQDSTIIYMYIYLLLKKQYRKCDKTECTKAYKTK